MNYPTHDRRMTSMTPPRIPREKVSNNSISLMAKEDTVQRVNPRNIP